jgi:hypothetical protein
VITAEWGAQALEALLPDGDLALLGRERPTYASQVGTMGGHAVAFATLALLALWWQGRAKNK